MTRKKNSQVEWLTMGPAPYFATCQGCGEHVEAPKLPMRIKAFVKYADFQVELHRYCEPKSESSSPVEQVVSA